MKRLLALILALLLIAGVLASCDEAVINGSVEADQSKESKEESKDTTSDGTPMLRINETNNKWEISTDGGKTWKNTGVSATGENGADGTNGANGSDGKDGANGENGTNGKDGNGILKIEVIENNVWITYTSDPNNPVNVGKVTVSQYDLDFYPLPDGTYGVKAGNSIYAESVIIPATYNGKAVTRILSEGFKNAINLKEITIPNSIKIIEANAFNNCQNLSSITIPSGVTRIEANAFDSCKNLSSITIPNSVTKIETDVFSNCIALNNVIIPESITSIESNVFYNCNNLSNITIPASVTSIGSNAFCGCDTLSDITLPKNLTSIGSSAFVGCGITNLTLPASVTYVGENAFGGCNIEKVYYEGTIASWCNITFDSYGYDGLSLDASNPISIAEGFYVKNSSGVYELVEDLIIPEGVERIGVCSFFHYRKLRSVTLPSTLKVIKASAFAWTPITSITIPKSVTTVEKLAFMYCSFTEVRFDGSLEEWNNIYFHNNPGGDWASTSNPLRVEHPSLTPPTFYTKNALGEYVLTNA